MTCKTGRTGVAVAGLMLTLMSHAASAQWHVMAIGVGEYDTKQTALLLGGLSASPGGQGISPVIGVQAYWLGYDAGTTRTNVFTVKPYLGLSNGYDGGAVYGDVGYAFANSDVSVVSPVATSTSQGKGVVLAGGWDHWGTGGPTGYQLLGSYNFDSESFWGRGRITQRMGTAGPSQRRIGGEVAYLTGKGYSAVQPGVILELHNPQGNILGLGAGMKFFGNNGGSAVYFKIEGVLPDLNK